MQLRLTPFAFKATGAKFNWSISAILSGVTAVGTLTAVVVNSNLGESSITKYLDPLKQAFISTPVYSGIEKVAKTLKDWGGSIVSSKDAFVDWFKSYFGPDGLKAGVSALYEKLKVWALIVYEWFATKFIKFIENIPAMVRDWDKLRLSLFKWGTFLGGGGGSALWAMFGSGENLGRLAELMGREDFGEMMDDFNTLVQDNPKAFEDLGAEGIEKIIEAYLDDPDKAKEAAKELIQEQKDRKEEAKEEKNKLQEKEEEKENTSKELTAEEISNKFDSSKTGNPPDKGTVFKGMVDGGLKKLLFFGSYSFKPISEIKETARKGMEEYLENLNTVVKKENKKKGKKPSVKAQFMEIINKGDNKNKLLDALADAAVKAYDKFSNKKLESLTDEFVKALTKPCSGDDCDADVLQKALKNNEKK